MAQRHKMVKVYKSRRGKTCNREKFGVRINQNELIVINL